MLGALWAASAENGGGCGWAIRMRQEHAVEDAFQIAPEGRPESETLCDES